MSEVQIWRRDNAANFHQDAHSRHPIARPRWWGMGVCCDSNNWFTFCHCYCSIVLISWWIRPRYNGSWLHFANLTAVHLDIHSRFYMIMITKEQKSLLTELSSYPRYFRETRRISMVCLLSLCFSRIKYTIYKPCMLFYSIYTKSDALNRSTCPLQKTSVVLPLTYIITVIDDRIMYVLLTLAN